MLPRSRAQSQRYSSEHEALVIVGACLENYRTARGQPTTYSKDKRKHGHVMRACGAAVVSLQRKGNVTASELLVVRNVVSYHW